MSWTVFPRIYTSLQSKVCFQFCFQVRRPVASTSRPIYVILRKMINRYRNIWFMKIQNVSIFLFLKKQPQKRTNFSTFYLTFKGPPFQYHKVRHPNFLKYTASWNEILKFELKKDSFFINVLTKVLWKTLWMRYRKNGIAYSTARNLKTAYLWKFHFQ